MTRREAGGRHTARIRWHSSGAGGQQGTPWACPGRRRASAGGSGLPGLARRGGQPAPGSPAAGTPARPGQHRESAIMRLRGPPASVFPSTGVPHCGGGCSQGARAYRRGRKAVSVVGGGGARAGRRGRSCCPAGLQAGCSRGAHGLLLRDVHACMAAEPTILILSGVHPDRAGRPGRRPQAPQDLTLPHDSWAVTWEGNQAGWWCRPRE